MPLHTLFVCQSCSAVQAHDEADEQAEGNQLLMELVKTQPQNPADADLNIMGVGCLWSCNRPCTATFVCPDKYTYQFVDLNHLEHSPALLEFSRLYGQSANGYVLPAKVPKPLRTKLLVRIPPIPTEPGVSTEGFS
jgi:predicted metal-binding protein